MFDIRFVAEPTQVEGRAVRRGRITLGDFREDFDAPLGYWTAAQYEAHWRAAAERLVYGATTTGFVVWATDLTREEYGLWWPARREGTRVAVRNSLLFATDFPQGARPEAAYRRLQSAEAWSANDPDGRPSQWYIKLDDVAAFLTRGA